MAIDQEIQRKVDAYRGNPQQLMQRYQQNQQLVDLLALQKLKSEKEAAARDMQLQMQQQPQTIKQQREAELLNMTKQEMMQQTQGVLMQRQAQQQQNMQQVAQQGLGALANQRPAPAPQGQPMPRMAAGGIVSFEPGGSVSGVTYEEWSRMSRAERRRAGLPESFLGGQDYFNRFGVGLGLNDPQTGERIRRETAPGSAGRPGRRDEAAPTQYGTSGSRARAGLPPIETAPLIPRLADAGDYNPASEDAVPMRYNPASEDAVPVRYNPASEDAVPMGYNPASEDALGGIPTAMVNTPPVSEGGSGSGQGGSGGGGGLPSLGGGGADAAMQRGFQIADQYTGRAEKAGRYADMEAELRALDAEQYDPREERRDQLKAFLAGTANTTNFGSTMAGGTLASLNMRERQKAGRRERLKDIFEMAERGMTLDATLASGGLDLGRAMYSEAMANQRAELSATASMDVAELQAEVRRAELEYEKLNGDRTFNLKERELEIEKVRNEVLGRQADAENSTRLLAATLDGLRFVQEQELDVYERVAENSQLPALQEQLFNAQLGSGRATEAEVTRIEAAIAAEEARVTVRAGKIFDDMNGVETRDMLAAQVLELTGTGATMLSMEDVAGIEQLDEEE